MTTATTMNPATTTPTYRPIHAVVPPPTTHWVGDGFRVRGYFHTIPDAVRLLSPFLLLDYHPEYVYGPTTRRRGVGTHPHRGFETVTLAFQGKVAHSDSTGNGGVIGPGDVQWMTAASGILHDEYHDAAWAEQGGPFQMVQLWVNLPAANKMDPPGYQGISADTIPTVVLPEGAGGARVIAGELDGVRGPAKTFTPIRILDVTLGEGGRTTLAIPRGHHAALLVLGGSARIQGERAIVADEFVVFGEGEGDLLLETDEGAHVLLLEGEPIREPVVQYGPFVMNTKREILQAVEDFESGRFGGS